MNRFVFILFFISKISIAQYNLVPNPSLEVTQPNDSCLFNPGTTEYVRPWSDIIGGTAFYSYDSCSYTDFFRVPNTINGYQIPHSGKSFGGLGTYMDTTIWPNNTGFAQFFRNYPFVKLKEALKNNHNYIVEFYVNLADISYYSCGNFGAFFSSDSLTNQQINLQNQNIFPQINNNPIANPLTSKTDWMLIHGCFTANGTEQYITIGNFVSQHLCDTTHVSALPTKNTVYFLDDVSVIELRANAFADDTLICSNNGFTKKLRVYDGMYNIQWSTGDTTQSIIVNQAGKYWVTATNECGTVTDTITINLRNPNAYKFNLGNDLLYCNSINKQLSIINPNLYSIVWSTNDTIPSINITQPGTYWATAQSECGLQTDTIIITKATKPNNIILQNDTTIYIGDTITITAIEGLEQYEWSATNGVISNMLLQSTTYTNVIAAEAAISIIAYTQDGCTGTDSITIKTIAKPVLELPIIIPNPQIIGKGGTFKILNLPPNNSVMLYDAMGQIVFKETNYTNNFSLDFIAEGIYFYEIKTPNQSMIKGKLLLLKK